MRQSAGALQFAEDSFFVSEEIADEAIAVTLVHGEGSVCSGAKDARGQDLR